MCKRLILALLLCLALPHAAASAQPIKVLSAGAYKQVLVALADTFQAETGNELRIENDTVGALAKRIAHDEAFDVAVLSPAAAKELTDKGFISPGSAAPVARVGVGVCVRQGAAIPDISSTAAFVAAVKAAGKVAYIDPAAGGSSGIYMAKLFERLGLTELVRAKSVLVPGGLVADHVGSGEADLGFQQVSELLHAKGVTLVGLLPEEIQNYTVYAAGLSAKAQAPKQAADLIAFLRGPKAQAALAAKGMLPAD